MAMVRFFLVSLVLLCLHHVCQAQTDTIPATFKTADSNLIKKKLAKEKSHTTDSLARVAHRIKSPRKATLLSTFVPGAGQIYVRKYWKAPICWAAVGIPAYTYFYNKGWYKKTQRAISLLDPYTNAGLNYPTTGDSINLVDPKLRSFMVLGGEQQLLSYRNEFRKDQDYSLLFFLLFWGLNVVDATVDAHLTSFDVSNQLSLHLQQPSESVGSTGMGVALVLDFHKPRYKALSAP
jgi:Family of unknown function (DUF5683)